jgi:hypothetical protein
MQKEFTERLGAFLRDEGFTNITTQRARHDVTVSAAKGDLQLVTHVADQVTVPGGAGAHHEVPEPAAIAVRPQVPAARSAAAPGAGGSGASGTRRKPA